MASATITGDIHLKLDSLKVEAHLCFTPNPAGMEWNSENLLAFLSGQELGSLPTPRGIEELLQKWAKLSEPANAIVARGLAPVPSTPEEVKWHVKEVPEDLAQLAAESLERAQPPELFTIKTERIKHEKIVKKASSLPFLPPKEEKLVEWEKIEKKERIFVDAQVLATFYCKKNEKVGSILAAKPGKPGKDVYGSIILEETENTTYHLGPGLRLDRFDIYSEYAGLIRAGKNWADVLPLARHDLEFARAKDGITPVLLLYRGDRRLPPPSAADIIEANRGAIPAGLSLRPIEEIDRAIVQAIRGDEVLVIIPLIDSRDAKAEVLIEEGGLKAKLHLRKALAGSPPLELKNIADAINASGVKGYKADVVKADVLNFIKGEALELVDYILVQGRAPERGEDRKPKLLASFFPEAQVKALLLRIEQYEAKAPGEPASFPATKDCHYAPVQSSQRVIDLGPPSSGSPGVDVKGAVIPGIPGNDPALHLGPGLNLVKNEVISNMDGLLILKEGENSIEARVIPWKDSTVKLTIAPDAMQAAISLIKEEGAGIPLSREEIDLALKEVGIIAGLQEELIAQALAVARQKGSVENIVIAKGKPPVAGGSMVLNWLIERASGKAVLLEENGRADFKNQDKINLVKEGQAIAEILKQGDDGSEGYDVRGRELSQAKGSIVEISHDESLREEPIEQGIRLIANRTGELLYDGKNMKISNIHAIKGNVGPATGNIKFSGEVRVSGSVLSGFAVMSDEDILVGENVEAALLSSGGRVVVAQGVLGAGKAVVRAKKTIELGFVEQTTLLAVEGIKIKNGCLLANVKVNGKLSLIGDKGHLIGGVCKARTGVECANLGNERGTRTEISFGQDYLLQDQIQAGEQKAEQLKKALVELDLRLKALEGHHSAAIDAARSEKVKLMKMNEKLAMHLFTLREKFEEHHDSEICVRGSVFPGVVMESHGRYYEVKQKKSQVVYYFDRELGRIQEGPLKK